MEARLLRRFGLLFLVAGTVLVLGSDLADDGPFVRTFVMIVTLLALVYFPCLLIDAWVRLHWRAPVIFFAAHVLILGWTLVMPIQQVFPMDGSDGTYRIPLHRIFGAPDYPAGDPALATADIVAGVMLIAGFLVSLGMYVIVLRVRRRTAGHGVRAHLM